MENQTRKVYATYTQSANTIFHFVPKLEFLQEILKKRVIFPRYCMEDIDYLELSVDNMKYEKIAVLQKCFCDIPLQKINNPYELQGIGVEYEKLSEAKKKEVLGKNTHTDFYGGFGIAFSKEWAEKNELQPVQYINENSNYCTGIKQLFEGVIKLDDIPDVITNNVIRRLVYLKPLKGSMRRIIKDEEQRSISVQVLKNFHDEKEWRYVPNESDLEKYDMCSVIANKNMLDKINLNHLNSAIKNEKYSQLWLKYDYNNIKYLIVQDIESRIVLINTISKLKELNVLSQEDNDLQTNILISKILVLDEIRKDI